MTSDPFYSVGIEGFRPIDFLPGRLGPGKVFRALAVNVVTISPNLLLRGLAHHGGDRFRYGSDHTGVEDGGHDVVGSSLSLTTRAMASPSLDLVERARIPPHQRSDD